MLHALGIELKQMRNAGSGRKLARRSRRVEHLVMRASEKLTDAYAAFVTRNRCRDEFPARRAGRLRRREYRGKYHRARMEHRAVVQVVLLDEMRRRAVDERREHG